MSSPSPVLSCRRTINTGIKDKKNLWKNFLRVLFTAKVRNTGFEWWNWYCFPTTVLSLSNVRLVSVSEIKTIWFQKYLLPCDCSIYGTEIMCVCCRALSMLLSRWWSGPFTAPNTSLWRISTEGTVLLTFENPEPCDHIQTLCNDCFQWEDARSGLCCP